MKEENGVRIFPPDLFLISFLFGLSVPFSGANSGGYSGGPYIAFSEFSCEGPFGGPCGGSVEDLVGVLSFPLRFLVFIFCLYIHLFYSHFIWLELTGPLGRWNCLNIYCL